ncbi:hypothetical protein J5X84_03645 [Streptosporangiaceae bacterium NEAU-GS5]|nr:hypothetical protein [Streptosporangiaceae bacterium NEAU-GS5]
MIAISLVAACGPADRGYHPGQSADVGQASAGAPPNGSDGSNGPSGSGASNGPNGSNGSNGSIGSSGNGVRNGVQSIVAAPGLQVEVEWPSGTRDPAIQSLVDSYVSQWRAVGTRGRDDSYLGGVEDEAGRDAYTWVSGFLSGRRSAQGVAKVYALRLTSVTGSGAEVDACVDESGLKLTDTSGTPVPEQPSWTKPPHAVYLQVAALHKGDDGAWRVKLFRHAAYPDERAKECAR